MTRNSILVISAFLALSAFASIQPALAKENNFQASKDAVLAACRHTSGCSYDSNPTTGETAGCSPTACFYCKPGSSTCGQVPGHAIRVADKPKHIIVGPKGLTSFSPGFGSNKVSQNLSATNFGAAGSIKSLNTNSAKMQKSLN